MVDQKSWNPEPPEEILSIQRDDLIEGTLFDKHSIVQLLLKLIRLVDDEAIDNDLSDDNGCLELKELDEELERELCDLWDMSSAAASVCQFLHEHNCLCLFEAYMRKYESVYPRGVELLLGIMVNMITLVDELSLKLVECDSLINYLLVHVFVGMTDTQSILQSVYLFNILVGYADEKSGSLRAMAKEKLVKLVFDENTEYLSSMLAKVQFILGQSLNVSLLDATCSLLLNLMYTSDSCLEKMAHEATTSLVESICSGAATRFSLDQTSAGLAREGYSTTRPVQPETTSDPRMTPSDRDTYDLADLDRIYNKYLLCLQTLSTCEPGTARLNESSESVFKLMSEYLDTALSLLTSWEARHGAQKTTLDGLVGEESISNFTCLTSTLDAILSSFSSTSGEIQFLIKFLSFASYYLNFLHENKSDQIENADLAVSSARELLKSLKDLSDATLDDDKLDQLVSECLSIVDKL